MDNIELSFFMGGIRPAQWLNLYNSCAKSCEGISWELVICGPYNPPKELDNAANFKFIRDFGSCSRAAQIAAMFCEGKLITLGADDGLYTEGSMARAVAYWEAMENPKSVLGLMYGENRSRCVGENWTAWHHKSLRLDGIPKHAPMILNSIVSREYFYEIGGYDTATFETCNWGGHSLINRFMNDGALIKLYDIEHVLICDWFETNSGDHAPIHAADSEDVPDSGYHKFKAMYSSPNPLTKIDFNNWRQAESIWSKRFRV